MSEKLGERRGETSTSAALTPVLLPFCTVYCIICLSLELFEDSNDLNVCFMTPENHDSGTGQQNGCRESSLLSLYLLNATEKEFSRAYRRRLQDRKQQLLDTGAADDSSQASTNSPSQSVKSPNRAST